MKTRVLFRFVIFHVILFTLLRVIFYFVFRVNAPFKTSEVINAFYLGMKFDLRMILLLALPLILLGWGKYQPLHSLLLRRLWSLFFVICMGAVFIIYIFDFGYYGYLNSRISPAIFDFLKNPEISGEMLWQSYPVVWVSFGFMLIMLVYYRLVKSIIFKNSKTFFLWMPSPAAIGLFVLLFVYGVYGHFSQYPLRWSDAFFSPHHFLSHLSLNPLLYLVETSEFKDKENFSIEKVRKSYEVMAPYLLVDQPNSQTLEFRRKVSPSENATPMNVVVIVMESMALSKTNLMSNSLNPTPSLEVLAKESYWFSNYYSPAEGTARNMFSIMTAIPDVFKGQTSSRNPLIVDQNLIMNSYNGYKKWYFLGGSASWANIRGIFSHNIQDIDIVEEGAFNAGRTDVWGVSDLDLFIEAHRRFAEQPQDKPFVAVIQSASFHRPYTIPKDHKDFKTLDVDLKRLKEAGFYSLEQYNSLRFSDYSLGYFFKLAKKSPYYKNTLFVVTGDHGLPDDGGVNVTEVRQQLGLERYHVPLVLHNKKLFSEPFQDTKPGTHMDLMTTVAALVGVSHENTTLGRNLFDTRYDKERFAFSYNYYSEANERGLLNEDFYYRFDDVKGGQLYNYSAATGASDVKDKFPEVYERMKVLTESYFETSKYLLYNNKKHQQ